MVLLWDQKQKYKNGTHFMKAKNWSIGILLDQDVIFMRLRCQLVPPEHAIKTATRLTNGQAEN